MVSVEEDDRDVLRFLWVEDVAKEPPDIKMYRFTRVVFGVSSSPFLLNATIKFHLEKYLETNEALVRQLHMSTISYLAAAQKILVCGVQEDLP